MLTCTNNSEPRSRPWLVVVLVVLVVVIAAATIPPPFIEYLIGLLLVVLIGANVGLLIYLKLNWAEN